MRYMPLDFIKPEHILAQPIYNKQFVEQLFDDGKLHKSRIEALRRLGYHSVFVREVDKPHINNAFSHLQINDLYSKIGVLFNVIDQLKTIWQPDQGQVLPLEHQRRLNTLIEDLESLGESFALNLVKQNHPVLHQYESKSLQLYPIQHAAHTALLALKIGIKGGLNIKSLKQLFLGAVLNDIGYFFISDFDLAKTGLLSSEIKLHQQAHVKYTHSILSQLTAVPGLVRNICLQHHEREDGKGYPNGLNHQNILPMAKQLSIAIAFDALVSDRPFRPAYSAHRALSLLKNNAVGHFDQKTLQQLTDSIAPFPLGTHITYQKKIGVVSTYDSTHKNPSILFSDQDIRHLDALTDGPIGVNYQV